MSTPLVALDDPCAADVRGLIERHLRFAQECTPPEDVHALDPDRLADPAVSFFSLRVDGRLLGIGALQQLDDDHIELKSIHTAEEARGRGLGRTMIDHLLSFAAERGMRRVSLETGSMDAFAAARSLFVKVGFRACDPFGDYEPRRASTFMTLELA